MDLGVKIKKGDDAPIHPASDKKIRYPSLDLRDEHFELIGGNKIQMGETKVLKNVKLRVSGLNVDEYGKRVSFEVVSADGFDDKKDDDDGDEKVLGFKRPKKAAKPTPSLSAKDLED